MLLFFIGVVIIISSAVMLLKTFNAIFLLLFMVGLLVSIISAFVPLSGWTEPKTISEHVLEPLFTGTQIYVVKDKKGNVMYKSIESSQGEVFVKLQSKECNVIQDISKDEIPVLKKSKVKPKVSLWAFPILSDKYIDVLCVPKDGILK